MLTSGDIFGIFRIQKSFHACDSLLVSPIVFDLDLLSIPTTSMTGGKNAKQKGFDTNAYVSGIREYLPGDPLKKIHWQSTAKNQQLMVKEYDKDPLPEVFLPAEI